MKTDQSAASPCPGTPNHLRAQGGASASRAVGTDGFQFARVTAGLELRRLLEEVPGLSRVQLHFKCRAILEVPAFLMAIAGEEDNVAAPVRKDQDAASPAVPVSIPIDVSASKTVLAALEEVFSSPSHRPQAWPDLESFSSVLLVLDALGFAKRVAELTAQYPTPRSVVAACLFGMGTDVYRACALSGLRHDGAWRERLGPIQVVEASPKARGLLLPFFATLAEQGVLEGIDLVEAYRTTAEQRRVLQDAFLQFSRSERYLVLPFLVADRGERRALVQGCLEAMRDDAESSAPEVLLPVLDDPGTCDMLRMALRIPAGRRICIRLGTGASHDAELNALGAGMLRGIEDLRPAHLRLLEGEWTDLGAEALLWLLQTVERPDLRRFVLAACSLRCARADPDRLSAESAMRWLDLACELGWEAQIDRWFRACCKKRGMPNFSTVLALPERTAAGVLLQVFGTLWDEADVAHALLHRWPLVKGRACPPWLLTLVAGRTNLSIASHSEFLFDEGLRQTHVGYAPWATWCVHTLIHQKQTVVRRARSGTTVPTPLKPRGGQSHFDVRVRASNVRPLGPRFIPPHWLVMMVRQGF